MRDARCSDKLPPSIAKAPTGITGLDLITRGGLPAGRPILVCGGPGCGKTLLAMEFLVRGIRDYNEPGLFMSFEERPEDLVENFSSLGFNIQDYVREKKFYISHVDTSSQEIAQSGSFSLEALIIRLQHGINQTGARRVVLDGMEAIFSALTGATMLRKEIQRVFAWLKKEGITTIITAEKGKQELTRHGFEEYLSDCVILLDHRVSEQIAKRRIRIVKYRGSGHDVDEFPLLIGEKGIYVFPVTSLDLEQKVLEERVSTGVKNIDALMDGGGYYKGSTVLISGKAGTGKSTLAAAFVAASCERQEPALYFALEESASQLTRNMRSVGIDLNGHIKKGLLTIQAFRPTLYGLEEHLSHMMEAVDRIKPECVVMDPISNFISVGSQSLVKSMLARFIAHVKSKSMTFLFTSLTPGSGRSDETENLVSSLVDSWIALNMNPSGKIRRREIYIVKSRGMQHSHKTMELVMSPEGLSLNELELSKEK